MEPSDEPLTLWSSSARRMTECHQLHLGGAGPATDSRYVQPPSANQEGHDDDPDVPVHGVDGMRAGELVPRTLVSMVS